MKQKSLAPMDEEVFRKVFLELFHQCTQAPRDITDIFAFLTDFVVTGMIEAFGPDEGLKAFSDRVNAAASALQELP